MIKRILIMKQFGIILRMVKPFIQSKWNSIFKEWRKITHCLKWYVRSDWSIHLIGWKLTLKYLIFTPKKAEGQKIFILIQITIGFGLPLLIIVASYWSLTSVISKHQAETAQSGKPNYWKKNEQKVNRRVIIFVSACE